MLSFVRVVDEVKGEGWMKRLDEELQSGKAKRRYERNTDIGE